MLCPLSLLHQAQVSISICERKRERERSSDEMATNQVSCNHGGDEDYIDMEVSSCSSSSSSSNFLCYTISSPPQSREFEFQMCSVSQDRDSTTSPADELFYKGKLLPLHLPPRLLMVEKLLQGSNTNTTTTSTFEKKAEEPFEENYAIPFIATTNTTSTPLESCNISPSESCRVSSELIPDEYFFEWSTEMSGFIGCDNDDQSKKSWTRKLKQIKKSSLGQKLKASRAYIKSLFSKSACSDEFCAKAACNVEAETISIGNNCLNKYMRVANKTPLRKPDCDRYNTKSIDKEMADQDGTNSHRRSFSGAIQRHCAIKCSSSSTSSCGSSSSSSSSFSFSSNGFYNLQLLKRSSSANLEIESSIEGAIAHCKQSQQLLSSRKAVSESGVCSLLASRMAVCGDQERPGVCSV